MNYVDFDKQYLWHPYTSMTRPIPAYPVESARGVTIKLADGRELIDGMSSWWCAIHGYNHPRLNAAIEQQINKVSHVMFGGFTHEPAVSLAQKLIELTPPGLDKVFLADSGSVAVEVAIKMALQYWVAQGKNGKNKLLAFHGAYHGDTFGAMSVSDPINGMHTLFNDVLPQHWFAPRPRSRFGTALQLQDVEAFESILAQHHDSIAAVIVEPIVQGAGGMWFYSADFLAAVRKLCEQYDVLLIADEIATGFGRSGKLFACEHAGIAPDILCLGKALTGGCMTLAATLATTQVAETISADGGVLMHGPTFMGNPLACAVANASIDLLLENDWRKKIEAIETILHRELSTYRNHAAVADVRVLGAIGVVECKKDVDVAEVQKKFVDAGVWIRPFGRLIYLMPPYVIDEENLTRLCAAIGLGL